MDDARLPALLAPGAVFRPVRNTAGDTMTGMHGLVLHVQQGDGSPWEWFDNPSSQASSTWWVGKDGTLEQYARRPDVRMWAQGTGNADWTSVETEGFVQEALTSAQVATLAKLYRWGHDILSWPYLLADIPRALGFGWHGMGGQPWGGHLGCPGDLRRGQRQTIVDLAKALTRHPCGPGQVWVVNVGCMDRDKAVHSVRPPGKIEGYHWTSEGWRQDP